MKIFSASQIRRWDSYTIQHEPVSSPDLMERAAGACFNWLTHQFKTPANYTIFCGTGNNGGDGLVIARMLSEAGNTVSTYILEGKKRSVDFSANLDRLNLSLATLQFINNTDFHVIPTDTIVIDALLGSGLSRPLTGLNADIVNYINQACKTIISIDLPTGLFADTTSYNNTAIHATHTLAFQIPKLAFFVAKNNRYTGNVHLLDIGLHPRFYEEEPTLFYTTDQQLIGTFYKPRTDFSHKYDFGHALLLAGSKNMMGAAVLCAKACLRTGAGLVTVFTEPGTQAVLQTALPEAISSTEENFEILSQKKAAIGIGPGLQPSDANNALLKKVITTFPGPLVIDATALQMLSQDISVLKNRTSTPAILTPHTGEFEKLFGKTPDDFERINLAIKKAMELNCYIILKGHFTLTACPDGQAFFNTTGNSGMATAGSGDTLTGMLTGLLAQGYSPQEACVLGVYLHGSAGDFAAEKFSREAMIAGDITDCIGEAYQKILTVRNNPFV